MINKNNLSLERVCSFFAADGHNHWQSRTDDFKDRQGEKSLFNFHSFWNNWAIIVVFWIKTLNSLNLNGFTTNLYRHNSFSTFTIYKKYLMNFLIELSKIFLITRKYPSKHYFKSFWIFLNANTLDDTRPKSDIKLAKRLHRDQRKALLMFVCFKRHFFSSTVIKDHCHQRFETFYSTKRHRWSKVQNLFM